MDFMFYFGHLTSQPFFCMVNYLQGVSKYENILRHLNASFIKIVEYGVEKMVYISCKPSSLSRDLEVFLREGYRVERVCCVDQFCQTVHVETVCLLSRK